MSKWPFVKPDYFTWKYVSRPIRITTGFFLNKIKCIRYNFDYLSQKNRFQPNLFFWKSDQGWLSMTDSSTLSSDINFLLRNRTFLFPGSQETGQHWIRYRVSKIVYAAQLFRGLTRRSTIATPSRPKHFAPFSYALAVSCSNLKDYMYI